MTDALSTLVWPADRLGEVFHALARAAGLSPETEVPGGPAGPEAAGPWIETAAARMGLEAEEVEVPYAEVDELIGRAAPALLRLPAGQGFLAVLRSGRRTLLLGPDHRPQRVSADSVRGLLRGELDGRVGPEVDALLERARVPPERRPRARAAMLRERLGQSRIGGCWLLGLPAGGGFRGQLRRAGVGRLAGRMAGAHAMQHVLLLASWWVLGKGVLAGHLDRGWLLAWALLLLTVAPFRALELWSAGLLTTRAGSLIKRRLMTGVLRLELEEIRHQGVGQLLGRTLSSEAVELLILTGGHVGLVALTEIVLAVPILAAGSGGWLHALLLIAWVGVSLLLCRGYFRDRRAWTAARLAMTHDLVEQMVGHRTRIAQQAPELWHEGEDRALEGYLRLSVAMDRRAALLRVVIPRGWLVISLLALAPGFVSGSATPAGLAVALGGALFAYKSFWKLVRGLTDLAEAAVSWEQVAPVFRAAGREERASMPSITAPAPRERREEGAVVVEAHDLVYRYGERADPVLRGCDLTVRSGERILLEGPSGGGKSTLASLLVGLRQPQSGLLLLEGLDRHSLGDEGWRRRAVAAPQFQENHVLVDTFAFNLLMGRDWPPRPADLEEAEAVCRELGLGPLLDRMPAGLQQMVGESGWQLSHGEKSRLYIARALLQRAELVVLDESFAALDPESLRQALSCVLGRARTLMVIAHP
ncbi:MAG: ATP-binding cassette domain-containing protein [Thermoanaerobaculia bacterium]